MAYVNKSIQSIKLSTGSVDWAAEYVHITQDLSQLSSTEFLYLTHKCLVVGNKQQRRKGEAMRKYKSWQDFALYPMCVLPQWSTRTLHCKYAIFTSFKRGESRWQEGERVKKATKKCWYIKCLGWAIEHLAIWGSETLIGWRVKRSHESKSCCLMKPIISHSV